LASNPQFFERLKPNIEIAKTGYSPVGQNIIFINSKKSRNFVELMVSNSIRALVKSSPIQDSSPKADKSKTAYFAFNFGKGASNIIYANGPSDTEKIAEKLCDYLTDIQSVKVDEFIDFIKEDIHSDYSLIKCLKKGVAFHYSTMPREIKDKIESLFMDEEVPITYLCCTSTLLEGMNLPAKNIFINKPTKGRNRNMEKFDFWNLAGRAGRLLHDFYGNIFCIDIDIWEGYVPTQSNENYEIQSATEEVLNTKINDLNEYLLDVNKEFPIKERELHEQITYTFVLNNLETNEDSVRDFITNRNLEVPKKEIEDMTNSINSIVIENKLPKDLLKLNGGIDPRLQNNLYDEFKSTFYVNLLPCHPGSRNFYDSLCAIFDVINRVFLDGADSKIYHHYAYLSSQWIREYPLKALIDSYIHYLNKENKFKDINSCVRKVVDEIDHILTYKYAKYLKCYIDILKFHLKSLNINTKVIDLSTFLEFGAYNLTTLSLIDMGLSRTTAIRLRRLIRHDDLNITQCEQWLKDNYQQHKDSLPVVCQEDFDKNIGDI
jgi:hypothetical protein